MAEIGVRGEGRGGGWGDRGISEGERRIDTEMETVGYDHEERRTGAREGQATSGRRHAAGDKRQATRGRRQAISGRRQAAGDKRQATSGKRQAAGDKRQAASGRRQAASGKRQAASGRLVVPPDGDIVVEDKVDLR